MTKLSAVREQVREMIEDSKPKVESIKHSNVGICATCRNSEACLYLQKAKEPIFQCEEFETTGVETPRTQTSERTSTESLKLELSPLKGLCRNCSRNATCKFTKPESGIWHCEEYE